MNDLTQAGRGTPWLTGRETPQTVAGNASVATAMFHALLSQGGTWQGTRDPTMGRVEILHPIAWRRRLPRNGEDGEEGHE